MLDLKSTHWCAGLLADHLFNLNFIFLSDGFMVAVDLATGLVYVGIRLHLDFCLQNAADREVLQIKV
jgi:hypothetical protein